LFGSLEIASYLKEIPDRGKKTYLVLVELAMQFIAFVALVIYTIGGIGCAFCNLDPLGRYIYFALSNSIPSVAIYFLKIFAQLLLGTELYRVIIIFFYLTLIVLLTLNNVLTIF